MSFLARNLLKAGYTPVQIVPTDSASDDLDAVTKTFSGMNFGAADPNRLIVVTCYFRENDGGRNMVSATIGGVPATIHTDSWQTGDDAYVNIISAVVPTGTSGDVYVQMGGVINGFSIGVFAAYDADPALHDSVEAAGLSATATLNINVATGGGVIALCGMKTLTGWTWTTPASAAYTENNTGSDNSGGYEEMIAAAEVGRTYEAVSLNSLTWQMHAISLKRLGT